MTHSTANSPTLDTKNQIEVGVFSEGTLRPEDLIQALQPVARDVFVARLCQASYEPTGENVELILDAVQEILPTGLSIGSHPGDGACFGIWPEPEALQENDDVYWLTEPREYTVNGAVLAKVPEGYSLVAVHFQSIDRLCLLERNPDRDGLWHVCWTAEYSPDEL